MGLKFRIFTKAEHYTMPSAAALLRKVTAAEAGKVVSPAARLTTSGASKPAAPKATSLATSSATSSAASVAAPKAAPKECAEFNRTGNPCSRGRTCRDKRCRDASATSPKSAVKGGDGDVSAKLAAIASQLSSMNTKVDGLTKQVATGFTETKSMLTDQQQVSLDMQKAMGAMMLASANFQSGITGLLTGGASRPELHAPPARHAICAPVSVRSTVTEMTERSGARGGGSSASEVRESGLTGAVTDPYMQVCAINRFPIDGTLFKVLCELCGNSVLSDYHRKLISSIGKVNNDDNLAALLFLLFTVSRQFSKSSFGEFRRSCDTMLGSNLTKTQATFSDVCDDMLFSMSEWQIDKKAVYSKDKPTEISLPAVCISNADLKNKLKRGPIFEILKSRFQI